MHVVEVNQLVEPCSQGAPCGPDLEADPAFIRLETIARETPEQQPNWTEVRVRTLELAGRTRDLRIGVLLARALLETDAWRGLETGLSIVHGLVTKQWESVHPILDPSDGSDPQMRINILASLTDNETMIRAIRRTPLAASPRSRKVSLRDVMIAEGKISPVGAEETTPPLSGAEVDSAFSSVDIEELLETSRALQACKDLGRAIETSLTDLVGVRQSLSFDPLVQILEDARRPVVIVLGRMGHSDTATDSPETARTLATTRTGGAAAGEIASREDAIRLIDKICDWFERNEPSSPVPILLHRAKRLVSKSFIDVVRDLVPEAVPKVDSLRGASQD